MHNIFSSLASGISAVSGRELFRADESGRDGFVNFFGYRLNFSGAGPFDAMQQKCSLQDIIKPQLQDNNEKLALFVCRELCTGKTENLSLPHPHLLFIDSKAYPLFECNAGDSLLKGKRLNLGLSPVSSIADIEKQYTEKKGSLESIAKKSAEEGHFYDSNANIGFRIIENRFYLFTKVQPYILFERKNNAYYNFEEAEVGAPLFVNNGIEFGKLYVLNSYSHPALPQHNKPMQCICTGAYDYSGIKRRHPDDEKAQLEELMEKARTILANEYRSSSKPYAYLNDSKFDGKRIIGHFDKSKVTNQE